MRFHNVTAMIFMFIPAIVLANSGWAVAIPFEIDTYGAVTKASFSTHAKQDCLLVEPGATTDLLEKSEITKVPFDEKRVRAVMEEAGNPLFVDARGVFQYKGGNHQVTEEHFLVILKQHFSCNENVAKPLRPAGN
ncbi:hypothetical protein [Dyella tabacisoli]|uniref:Uncharacterized protein n=1 Tax=Dyella tabacisoli TaxID=2282381 RepID=A0A369UK79_9GAMM|nr:hypothetical protein [Dyella tabacisoli]RDD80128.1 hypothetical protein DVJ77_18460 [Dyella tabacisoli]